VLQAVAKYYFIVMFIKMAWIIIFQQGNIEKIGTKDVKTKFELHILKFLTC